jgi:hypothetical protein
MPVITSYATKTPSPFTSFTMEIGMDKNTLRF